MQDQKDKQQHTKKRVSKACDCCRKSKTKCDGMRPCSRCLQDGKICTYMAKKKTDQMYPASYVDLLETRVSILVQSLNQLLAKSKLGYDEFQSFTNDPQLCDENDNFDVNKVICKLMSNEKLNNLAKSNQTYTLDDITHVTNLSSPSAESPRDTTVKKEKSTPQIPTTHHYSLAKAVKQNPENHIHKHTPKKISHISTSPLSSSFHTRFNVGSPLSMSSSSSSLDITGTGFSNNQQGSPSIADIDFDNLNFNDTNQTPSLMSPTNEASDANSIFSPSDSPNFDDLFIKSEPLDQGWNFNLAPMDLSSFTKANDQTPLDNTFKFNSIFEYV